MEKEILKKSKVDVTVLNCVSKSKVDETVLDCMSGRRKKRLKTIFIKPEDKLLIKDLTINDEHLTNTTQANKVILKDFQMSEQKILEENIKIDFKCKKDDLQQSESPRDGYYPLIKGHHTPPHLVYSILPDTPVSDKLYREPSGLHFW